MKEKNSRTQQTAKVKKQLKSFGALGVLLILCLILGVLYRNKMQLQNKETTNDSQNTKIFQELPSADTSVTVKGYTASERLFASKDNIYFRQETGLQEGVEYTIEQVLLEDSFENLEDYYRNRDGVSKQIDLNVSMDGIVVYKEELRCLKVRLVARNKTEEEKEIQSQYFYTGNIREDRAVFTSNHPADWRVWNEKGEEKECKDKFYIPPDSEYTIELVFVELPAYIYDYYLEISAASHSARTSIYLSLDLALHETDGYEFITDENAESTEDMRDLAQLKVDHITNKDLADSQQQGTTVLERYFHESSEVFGHLEAVDWGEGFGKEIYDSKLCTLEDVFLVDSLSEVPESFQSRTYLRDMTKVYMERFGYPESDLNYLILTVRIEQKETVEELLNITNISQLLWIYNRDEENRLWRIGYPDDYEVKQDGSDEAVHTDRYLDSENAVHIITAAYVIWPGALKNVYLWEPRSIGSLPEGEKNSYANDNLDDTAGGVKIEVH